MSDYLAYYVLADRRKIYRDDIEEEVLSLAPEFEAKTPPKTYDQKVELLKLILSLCVISKNNCVVFCVQMVISAGFSLIYLVFSSIKYIGRKVTIVNILYIFRGIFLLINISS